MTAAAIREALADRVGEIRMRYPTARSAIMPALELAQEEFGPLDGNAYQAIAGLLDVPEIWVFEVVDMGLHRMGQQVLVDREGDLGIVHQEITLGHLFDALADHLQAFAHLVQAALPAVIAVAVGAGDHLEVEPAVDLVRLIPAQIPVHPRSTQVRAAEAKGNGVLSRDIADILHSSEEDAVVFQQGFVI